MIFLSQSRSSQKLQSPSINSDLGSADQTSIRHQCIAVVSSCSLLRSHAISFFSRRQYAVSWPKLVTRGFRSTSHRVSKFLQTFSSLGNPWAQIFLLTFQHGEHPAFRSRKRSTRGLGVLSCGVVAQDMQVLDHICLYKNMMKPK